MSLRGVNLVMAVFGFVMSTLFISFVCIRLIVAHIRLARSSSSNHSLLECGFRGLEPQVIAKFPTKKYGDTSFHSSGNSQCVICLAGYCKESTLRLLPYCGHFFHLLCIDKWLHQHSTCPICRISLREFPNKPRMPPMYSSSVRPNYHIEFPNFDHCYCLSGIQDCPMRGHSDHGIEPIRENLLHTERPGQETGESIYVVIEGSRNKTAEGTSNT